MAVDREGRDELADALSALMRGKGSARRARAAARRAQTACEDALDHGLEADLGLMYAVEWTQDVVWPTATGAMAADRETWEGARRALAVLRSDVDWGPANGWHDETGLACGFFESADQCQRHQHLVEAEGLPEYDEARHNHPPRRPQPRVPGWVTVPLVLTAVACCAIIASLVISLLTRD